MRREKIHLQVALGRAAAAPAEAELEDAGALEEELALLGKEHGKAREVHDRLVDFRLREVGVDRDFRRQRRREADLHGLESDIAQRIDRRRAARHAVVEPAQRIRLHAQLQSGPDTLDTGQVAGL